jgi:hypothetical protein
MDALRLRSGRMLGSADESFVKMWSDRERHAVYLACSCRLSVSRYLSIQKTFTHNSRKIETRIHDVCARAYSNIVTPYTNGAQMRNKHHKQSIAHAVQRTALFAA